MSAGSARPSQGAWLYDLAAGLLCLIAFVTAWNATHDLTWPCESDLYRDMGAAQSLLDGRLGEDPAYLGERWWYPPLVPALIGTASAVTGTPLHEAYTRFGTLFNLLAPVGLYTLAARLFGRGAALASLAAFLFFGQLDLMSWLNATYSPWLWPCNLAQGFFYLTLALLLAVFERDNPWLAAGVGLLWGATFLAHAAPGFLLGGIFGVLVLGEGIAQRADRVALRRLSRTALLVLGVAFLVTSPYVFDLLVHYRGKLRNPAPLTWLAGELTIETAVPLAKRLLSLRGIVALGGVLSLFLPLLARRARVALGAWLVFSGLGLAYGYVAQRVRLPPLLPSWHFYFYLQAFESVAFGAGLLGVVTLLERAARRLFTGDTPKRRLDATRWVDVATALVLVAALMRGENYAKRADLSANRDASLTYAKLPEVELYEWALDHLKPSDVVLADPSPSFFVAAAGRKVVWLTDIFSNPYVKLRPRADAGTKMFSALLEGRYVEFSELATQFHVGFVAVHSHHRSKLNGAQPKVLKRRLRSRKNPGFDIYEIVASRNSR